MNLPNALTLARIFLVPLLVVVLLTKFEGHLVLGIAKGYVAAGIFGLASLTDWLDGYLARRRQQVTILGQLLDPIADKLLISAALVSLVQLDLAPAWMAAIIIGRELAVTGLRGIAQTRGLIMPASPLGKAKMMTEVIAILLLMLGQELGPALIRLGQLSLWVVLAFALWSAVEYYQTFTAVLTGRAPALELAVRRTRAVRGRRRPAPAVSSDSPRQSASSSAAAAVGRINGHAVADPAASRNYPRPAPRRS